MIIKLNINDRAALAMKNGTKKIEIRAGANYDKLNYGDIIEFSSNNLGKFYVKVEGINHYNSLDELFTLEGTRYTVSSTNDKKEAILNVEKIVDYKNIIKEICGVIEYHSVMFKLIFRGIQLEVMCKMRYRRGTPEKSNLVEKLI